MIIQLSASSSEAQIQAITNRILSGGYKSSLVTTQNNTYLVCIGQDELDIRSIGMMKGVTNIHMVNDDYKLVSSKWRHHASQVVIGSDTVVGGSEKVVMAGPCSIESEEQVSNTIEVLKKLNIKVMRGGVFKPRSSPYSFRGLGLDGLKMFYDLCQKEGISIVTEVMREHQIEDMYEYVDVFQVGARNSQNFPLLDALGKVDKPVIIKRGISGTIDELLHSAEYVFSSGNERIILCERGIRTYEKASRNTLDLNAVPILKKKTHLPVIVDPSHGIGIREFVQPMAMAAIACGADGLLIETHKTPERAFSDANQTINFIIELQQLVAKIRKIEKITE